MQKRFRHQSALPVSMLKMKLKGHHFVDPEKMIYNANTGTHVRNTGEALADPCNPGLTGYLPRPEWQNLNQIKLQPYLEWRDGQKADEEPNEWPQFHRHNELYEGRHESRRKKDHRKLQHQHSG
ncbi:hypothetical protein TNCV_1169271 [Trichonephila clavipes]|uniref:Uncharacterized protein n=1 Tax=Trichonephila clavipes TaxID=2585209 RepID=A0A8X6T8W8_TRICX|nr:hypothetical protein TNCV_1169271 [Trichonephila clavipes]